MKKDKLMREIRASGITIEDIADKIGVARSTLYRKISGDNQFNTDEVEKLCTVLGITDNKTKVDIFLS